ncbi:ferredoxin reductase-like C-terminal NADP-linked domain-containing protein [Paxillus ammoniavirescens]|nr:ferredoxin reductase-like C-terminal NADP-linked domain-containing protein [Paxillus ammoniavirescens]
MNRDQFLFVFSFLSTFAVLWFASYVLQSKLKAAGYDVSRLILIGLEPVSVKDISAQDSAGTTMGIGYTQLIALALAIASSTIIYAKFASSKRKPVLNPKEFQQFSLQEKIVVSPNTAIYRFALPRPDDVLGLPIGQHISISADINGKEIMRSYTPTSSDDDLGYFDLLIKSYEKGNISRYVSLLKIGDKVKIRGPKGFFKYTPTLSRHIGMIAGGTGITPMLQIIRAALKNPADRTKLSLIYANVNLEDILLKKELDALAAKHPHRFTLHYVLNNAPEVWTGGVGFVSKEHIEGYLPPSSDDIKILLCGPPPMMTAMKKHLAELNYPAPRTPSKLEDQVFVF